jgi:acyl-homoserine lactone acylase PvdQ
MGIASNHKKDLFWNYYLTLVKELAELSNYIEFDEANFETYSIELAKLLMAASSEVDVVLKQLCASLNNKKKHENINDYRKTIKASSFAKDFSNETVIIPLHGLTLNPWTNWNGKENPDWWKAYNNVKHERNNNFPKANLKNVLNAVSALFVCIVYLRAIERLPKHNGDISMALSWAWGNDLKPRERFLNLDRTAYPLVPNF